MANSLRLLRLASAVMLIGGLLLSSSTEFARFPYPLLLCLTGGILTAWHTDRYHATWAKRAGMLCLLAALLCTVVGILGYAVPLVVFTSKRYGEGGNLIDVIQYPLSYFTDRYGSVSALLLLGVGLMLLAASVRAGAVQWWRRRILAMLALLSLMLYLGAVIDVYLDGETPGVLIGVLWRVFAFGWMAFGLMLLRGQQPAPIASYTAQR